MKPTAWRHRLTGHAIHAAFAAGCASSTAFAAPAMDPALPALLRPQVQAAVMATLPPALQPHARVDMHWSAARGAALRPCADQWHVGALEVQQISRIHVPLSCLGERGSVVARVQLQGPVPHVRHALPAEHRLHAQDIVVRTATITHIAHWLSSTELPGQVLRKATAADTPLDARAVQRPVLLRRGDAVQIEAQAGAVMVRVAGIATATARLGDTVTVRNARTQQLVQGRLIAPGVVQAAHTPLPGQARVKVLPESSD